MEHPAKILSIHKSSTNRTILYHFKGVGEFNNDQSINDQDFDETIIISVIPYRSSICQRDGSRNYGESRQTDRSLLLLLLLSADLFIQRHIIY